MIAYVLASESSEILKLFMTIYSGTGLVEGLV